MMILDRLRRGLGRGRDACQSLLQELLQPFLILAPRQLQLQPAMFIKGYSLRRNSI